MTRHALNGLLALFALLCLTGCNEPRLVVRTEIVEAPVRQYVVVPRILTEPVPEPAKPAPKCIDSGRPSLCNPQLIEWRDETADALGEANAKLERIRNLKGDE